jgi:DNA-binding transcriptional ArsR family regulator
LYSVFSNNKFFLWDTSMNSDSTPDPFDLKQLALPTRPPLLVTATTAPPRHRPGEKFLKGPIPWSWITAAAALRGKALLVGLDLWREAGCRKARTVPLNLSHLADTFDISRLTVQRALKALTGAGLVSVAERAGRPPLVTLLHTE